MTGALRDTAVYGSAGSDSLDRMSFVPFALSHLQTMLRYI
jgi:hypothetical protein